MNDSSSDETLALEGLLRWYAAMGVDAAIDDMPHDRFAAVNATTIRSAVTAEVPPPAPQPPLRASAESMPASAEALVQVAEARAAAATDLAALRQSFETLPGLKLASTAKMIFADGVAGSPLMLIGGAPDSDEERQGAMFAGTAGRLLDAMLAAIGLTRAEIYMAHLVPWRPPGNRLPTPLELSLCLPFARRHIALAAPRLILCLGERAAQPLLGSRDPISRLRGRWLAYEGEAAATKLLATFSPAYLLSQPLQKRRAWTDLQMLAAELASSKG